MRALVLLALAGELSAGFTRCDQQNRVYADVHDQDSKKVTIAGTSMSIEPVSDDQNWVANALIDRETCVATVDFNASSRGGILGRPHKAVDASFLNVELKIVHQLGIDVTADLQVERVLDDGAVPDYNKAHASSPIQAGDQFVIMNGTQVSNLTEFQKLLRPRAVLFATLKRSLSTVTLRASLVQSTSPGRDGKKKMTIVYTDPTGTVAEVGFPVNQWVATEDTEPARPLVLCPRTIDAIFADMHDGDLKHVSLTGTVLTFRPVGNVQEWTVHAAFDPESCSAAAVNFDVPGKPNAPPFNLTASYWSDGFSTSHRAALEFTDPLGNLAAPGFPINRWIEVPGEYASRVNRLTPPECSTRVCPGATVLSDATSLANNGAGRGAAAAAVMAALALTVCWRARKLRAEAGVADTELLEQGLE